MPGKVKVKILQGKNLPVMDRSSDTTDAYVEIKLGNTTYKTDVCRKSLNPQWNSEWYRFEVDDSELQDEPLQIRVMDHDTYSANDAIGKVYLNLNPLLLPASGHLVKYGYNTESNLNHDNSKNSVMSGWIPVYDTMHGIRGEVNVIVKVELFSDFNKFRQSSCGVQFFCSPTVPHGYYAEVIHGFVEELIVNDDPEYQWIDKIRTPRASNEARQTLFFKLSGELQRKIGVKALNLGGNAVIGYNQLFDLEGESGIVARGIGTAVTLVKIVDQNQSSDIANNEERALNYLKFVGCGKKFHLNLHPFKCNLFIPTPKPIYLQNPMLKSNNKKQKLFRTTNTLVTKSSPALTMQTSLTTLLKQEDDRGTPGSGISQRIKNLKYSSQNTLSKKMTALKAKLGDVGIGEEQGDDLIHPKVLLKQKKQFQRASSDSSVMAELLAKSVIDVHNSLTCILEAPTTDLEAQENERSKHRSAVPKLLNKSVSESNISSNDKNESLYLNSESSSSDDDEDYDEDNLDEPQNHGEFDTISDVINKVHILENNSDKKDFLSKFSEPVKTMNTSTTSLNSCISRVEENIETRNSNSVLIAPISTELQNKNDSLIKTAMQTMLLDKVHNLGTSTPPISPSEKFVSCESDTNNTNLVDTAMKTMLMDKVNILGSYTPPSTPKKFKFYLPSDIILDHLIEDSSKFQTKEEKNNSKRESNRQYLSLPSLEEKSEMELTAPVIIDSTTNNSLVNTAMKTMLLEKVNLLGTSTPPTSPKRFNFDTSLENDSNTSIQDIENVNLSTQERIAKIQQSQKQLSPKDMNIKSSSLVSNAMQTMLLDKFNLLETVGTPSSSQEFNFDIIPNEKNEISHKQTSEPIINESLSSLTNINIDNNSKHILNTAMETMLLEKVNILGTYTPPTSPNKTDVPTFSAYNRHSTDNISRNIDNGAITKRGTSNRHSKILIPPIMVGANIKNTSLINTAMQTMLLDKVNILGTYSPPTSPNRNSDDTLKLSNTSLSAIKSADMKNNQKKIMKSTTSTSFTEYLRTNDTVLGVPFTSITALKADLLKKQKSHPCLYSIQKENEKHYQSFINEFKQSNIINVSTSEIDTEPISAEKHKKFKIFSTLLKKTRSNSFINEIKTMNTSKLKKTIDKSRSTLPKFLSMFHLHKKYSNKNDDDISNCLDNKNNSQSSPCVLTITNEIGICDKPSNTEIDQGFNSNNKQTCLTSFRNNTPPPSTSEQYQNSRQSPEPIPRMSHSPAKMNNTIACIYRRSSDSDLSITPKGNSLTGSDRSGGGVNCNLNRNNIVLRSTIHQDNFDMLEYPFLTMTKFPPGFIVQLGGAISARSVKLLERNTNMEEPESRNDIWWSEIRMEIRSHARSLNCNAVLGYTETTSICEDVCVLSASGTAAIISFKYTEEMEDNFANLNLTKSQMTTSLDRNNFDKEKCIPRYIESNNRTLYESPEHVYSNNSNSNQHFTPCTLAHLPYDTNNVPVRVTVVKCGICMRGKVPDILIATIEPPENIPCNGRGCFVESIISRPLKDFKGESLAKDISDGLPFLEYELQRLLINKLKIKGMNSIFGLKIRISIGEKMLIGIATGTAMFLTLLPSPVLPKLVSDRNSDEKKLGDLKKLMRDTVKKNKEIYQLKSSGESYQNYFMFPEYDDSEDELNSIDLLMGNKDCCILEIDDPQDAEVINLLMEDNPPDGFHVVNTETVPGLQDLEIVKNLQLFTQIYRAKINASFNLHDYFRRLLQSLYFKLRRMVPCALCDLQFRVDLPEPDEIQLCVIGMALGLGKHQKKNVAVKRNDEELIFKLDEDQVTEKSVSPSNQSTRYLQTHSSKQKQRSPSKTRHSVKQGHIPYKERHGVDITPLSYVPGGKIERYLGNLNFFFIRETTSIREEGGLSGFIHSFITEVLAIVRAHITALGGNAMVAYFLTEWIVNYNLHKNQGQCLINVGGDVVVVSYFDEDE